MHRVHRAPGPPSTRGFVHDPKLLVSAVIAIGGIGLAIGSLWINKADRPDLDVFTTDSSATDRDAERRASEAKANLSDDFVTLDDEASDEVMRRLALEVRSQAERGLPLNEIGDDAGENLAQSLVHAIGPYFGGTVDDFAGALAALGATGADAETTPEQTARRSQIFTMLSQFVGSLAIDPDDIIVTRLDPEPEPEPMTREARVVRRSEASGEDTDTGEREEVRTNRSTMKMGIGGMYREDGFDPANDKMLLVTIPAVDTSGRMAGDTTLGIAMAWNPDKNVWQPAYFEISGEQTTTSAAGGTP